MTYRILEIRARDDDSQFVLCELPDNVHTPYVTWVRFHANDAMFWGSYFQTLTDAKVSLKARATGYGWQPRLISCI